ncbi:hypothetical protein L7D48_25035 [Streptomyces sp. S1A]|uniref:hypothetical protein n=1 Tax=Streptomyces sp. ICN903 TaxID=2964654 RepID=UPI001EDC3640|nr:hypothetical protein [Streptomyces sp. ICN903]MCG3043798.1 hypothetical protein [Streptomyces sp. ICN903]
MSSPHVTVRHHDEFGVVAWNVRDHHLVDHMLRLVGFEPVPGQALYALTEPDRDPTRRARQAIGSLRAARLTVVADAAYDITPSRRLPSGRGLLDRRDRIASQTTGHGSPVTGEPSPSGHAGAGAGDRAPAADTGPDVAFGVHPSLGVVAAVTDGRTAGERILREQGFRYQPRLDVYTLPDTSRYREAVQKVARTSAALQRAGLTVAAQPHLAASVVSVRVPSRAASARAEGFALGGGPARTSQVRTAQTAATSRAAAAEPRPTRGPSR